MKHILIAFFLSIVLTAPAYGDDEIIRGRFDGGFTGAAPPDPVAQFEGSLRIDDDRIRFTGESYAGAFPDGTTCLSPIGVCSIWSTDEGQLFNQTDTFIPAGDGSFTQTITFVGGNGDFEEASGTASVKGTLDNTGGFEGRFRGAIFEGDDDIDDDDE